MYKRQILFSVVNPGDVAGIDAGATLYALLDGAFAAYAGGDWTGEGQLSLYTTQPAPIPLPAGMLLLLTGVGAFAAVRRKA